MKQVLDTSSPVAIGGVGGSGTRVVTQMLIDMGYHMGRETNAAHDNLWFRFLIKRPDWYARHLEGDREEIHKGLSIFTKLMTGCDRLAMNEWPFVMKAVSEDGWRGVKRLLKLLRVAHADAAQYTGWGWKEPNTYIFIDVLNEYYAGFKYIHTIRHGLDMAFSKTRGQLYEWGAFFDVDVPEEEALIPKAFLQFWVEANDRAIRLGEELGPERFLLLDFDKLCTAPEEEVIRLIHFLGLDGAGLDVSRYSRIPQTPKSMGRYKGEDLRIFTPEEIDRVRAFRFEVET